MWQLQAHVLAGFVSDGGRSIDGRFAENNLARYADDAIRPHEALLGPPNRRQGRLKQFLIPCLVGARMPAGRSNRP